MIVHCGKPQGYVEPVVQKVSVDVTDKPVSLFVIYWLPNKRSKAMIIPRPKFNDWLSKNKLCKLWHQLALPRYADEIEEQLMLHMLFADDVEIVI